jgi:hypothetical protein
LRRSTVGRRRSAAWQLEGSGLSALSHLDLFLVLLKSAVDWHEQKKTTSMSIARRRLPRRVARQLERAD